jgi:hypothetical protein
MLNTQTEYKNRALHVDSTYLLFLSEVSKTVL